MADFTVNRRHNRRMKGSRAFVSNIKPLSLFFSWVEVFLFENLQTVATLSIQVPVPYITSTQFIKLPG